MRLIDADQMINSISINDDDGRSYEMLGMLVAWIKRQPTIDAVPVIRCKDCKECEELWNNKGKLGICNLIGGMLEPNDFCCKGKRRSGNETN